LGGIVRGLVIGIIVFIISLLFTEISINNIFLTSLFAILTSLTFAFAGLLNAIYAKKFDHISIIPTFVLTPLTYLGGVFYSVDNLPDFWQNVSRFNPVLYMVSGFRYGFFGFADVSIALSLLILFGFVFILGLIDLYLLNKGVGIRS